MKQVPSLNPHRLIYRQSFPWVWIIALPGLAFALVAAYYVVFSPFGMLADVMRDNGVMRYVGIGILGVMAIWLLSYIYDNFVRVGCTVDAERRRIVAEWGLVLPVIPTVVPIEDEHALAISGIVRRSGGGTTFEYYLDVVHPRRSRVRIGKADEKASIIDMARAVADAVRVNVYDATYEPPEFIHSGHLAEAQRLLDKIRETEQNASDDNARREA